MLLEFKIQAAYWLLASWSLLILAILVNILGQAIHESGHNLVYQVIGHGPVWGVIKTD